MSRIRNTIHDTQFKSKLVHQLSCLHCTNYITSRAMKAILLADTKVSTSIQSSIYFEKDWIVFNWCPSTFMSIGWYHIFTLNLFVFGKKCCVFMLVHNKYISVNDISYLIHTILLILYTKPIVYCLFHFLKLSIKSF